MKNIFITLLVLLLLSFKGVCQNEEIQGQIYIKLIDVQNLFDGLSNEKLSKMNQIIANPNLEEAYSDSEKKLIMHYKFLRNNSLLNKPHFKLKMETGVIINVYSENGEYLKLKNKLESFNRYEEQINVRFKGIKKSEGFFSEPLYYANKIIFVEKLFR